MYIYSYDAKSSVHCKVHHQNTNVVRTACSKCDLGKKRSGKRRRGIVAILSDWVLCSEFLIILDAAPHHLTSVGVGHDVPEAVTGQNNEVVVN